MRTPKIYYVKVIRVSLTRPNREYFYEGTLERLINDVFGYTLEVGNSWDRKVNRHPKSFNSLITNLNKAKAASCRYYQSDYYEPATREEFENYKNNSYAKAV